MMDFAQIFTEKRVGSDKKPEGPRSGFQRDFDRLIFSSAFRRLQNKTQVFPLPGTAFVHNRLTHSLEVASVGRSLGKMTGELISKTFLGSNEEAYEFYRYELTNVIAAGCLAHDIGNPAFGHSGEKAISAYFTQSANDQINGKSLREHFNDKEWADLCNFEGNANAIRVLTHSFRGRFKGGFGLTYTTIASILKYPCEARATDKAFRHRKKYGFFQTEKETIRDIAHTLNMIPEGSEPLSFKRHPFVYLVEAADDICYSIVDMEDAHRLGILSSAEVSDCFMQVIHEMGTDSAAANRTYQYFLNLEDKNEGIAFLRARLINMLVHRASDVFMANKDLILNGNFNSSLMDDAGNDIKALQNIAELSVRKIYGHPSVIQIEIAGFNVLSQLLQLFIPALLNEEPSLKDKKIKMLLPFQFTEFIDNGHPYQKVISALDHISGMTDEYATEMYRRLTGIVVPSH